MSNHAKTIITVIAVFALIMCLASFETDADTTTDAPTTDGTYVAEVGGTQYETLEEAFASAQGTATISLLDDANVSSTITMQNKDITLELNGHTITFVNQKTNFQIFNCSLKVVGPGTVKEGSPFFSPFMVYPTSNPEAENYSVLTIGEGVESIGWAGVFIDPNEGNSYGHGVVVDVYGKLTAAYDGSSYGYGLYINGTIASTESEGSVPEITIHDTAVLDGVKGMGIYAAGYGDWTIEGGVIKGLVGIEIRAGSMTIEGGTISGSGTFTELSGNPSGTTSSAGAALVIAQHTTALPIQVDIDGGTFEAEYAVYQGNPQNNQDAKPVSVEISGGTFNTTATDGRCPVVNSENTKRINIIGGTFENPTQLSTELIDPAYDMNDDGTIVADLEASVAKVGDRYYTDIRQAISDAPEGETVLLLKPITVTGTNLNIRNGITLDLGSNTITIGETGTYNVGIAFSGGNCYLENGTIIDTRKAAESKSMFTIYVVGENTSLTTTNLNITVTNSTLKNSTSIATFVTNYGTLTLGDGTVINSVGEIQEGSSGSAGAFIQGVSGTSSTPTKLTVLDGVNIHVNGFAISGNGTDGYSDTTIDIQGGEYISDNAAAVYHPQNGKLTVANATLTGTTGIELRSGTAIIGDGAVITGTGNPFESDPNGNGSTTTGAGIAVMQHTTKKEISLTVNGGTISGYRAIYEENLQKNDDASIKKIDIMLNGGTFEAINGGTESVKIVDSGIIGDVVYGGSYNTDVSDYTVDGADVTKDDDGNQVVLPPVRFKVDQINTYTPSFELPYVSKGGEPTFSSDDGVTFNGNIATVNGTPYSVTIRMTATYNGVTYTDEVFVLCYITDDGSEEGNVMITSPESAWEEFKDRVDDVVGEPDQDGRWIVVDVARTDALDGPVRFSVTDVLRTQGQMNYDFGDEGYQVFAVHFGDEIDYPAVEIIDGEVYITPSGFSTFAFYVYLPEPEPDINPPIIWDDDDDYVPIPPVIVDDSSDDDTVTIVACAAAAVVAALMAAFLIIERRK